MAQGSDLSLRALYRDGGEHEDPPHEGDKKELRGREEQIGSLGLADLLSTEWMNTKVLQHSRGNCIQYPVMIHNGKGYDKECVCSYD